MLRVQHGPRRTNAYPLEEETLAGEEWPLRVVRVLVHGEGAVAVLNVVPFDTRAVSRGYTPRLKKSTQTHERRLPKNLSQ